MGAYSTTPLYKKLGIKEGMNLYVKHAPQDYEAYFESLPDQLVFKKRTGKENIDFIHLFVKSKKELEQTYLKLYRSLKKNGLMWVSWPKGSSKIPTDINRDWIREYILDNGLVDVKVASIDDDWSGLKFVYRVKDR